MKFYIAHKGTVDGPSGKKLSFDVEKKEVTNEEFTEAIDNFFQLHGSTCDKEKLNAEQSKKLCWRFLEQGKPVTLEDKILSITKHG